jgi:hypothetical protein
VSGQPWVEVVHRFAQIPEALLYDPTVDDGMIRVYGILLRHGSDPANCYPSHRRIADLTGKSKRTIPAIIGRLADAGWIEILPRTTDSGDSDSNGYRIYAAPRQVEPEGGSLTRGVYASERRPPTRENVGGYTRERAPKESNGEREPQNERNDPPTPAREQLTLVGASRPLASLADRRPNVSHDLAWQAFWDAYPRKVGKQAARRSWDRAIRAGVDPAEIVAGARRYAADPNRDPQYTKHPQGWLTDGRWADVDPLPVRTDRLSKTEAALGRMAKGAVSPLAQSLAVAAFAGTKPAALGAIT